MWLPCKVLIFTCLVLVLPRADAQSYPARPVRLIAASSSGSGVDIVARILAQRLSGAIGQQAIVDNRAGAGGNIGAEIAAKSAPDGYTLFVGTPTQVINRALNPKVNYNLELDFSPVSQLTTGSFVLVIHPSVPAKTVSELVVLAKSQPRQLNYASAGNGNVTHLAGAMFASFTKIDIVHVPYKGSGPALVELLGGQVQLMFSNLAPATTHIQSGRLRALAVTGEQRSSNVPAVPTMIEAGVAGYSVTSWYALFAPVGVSLELINKLHGHVVGIMRHPEVGSQLATMGAEPRTGTPRELAAFVHLEVVRWTKVLRENTIAVD